MSRAAIGAQVKALETKLGVRPLRRSTRNVVLTEAGVAYQLTLTGILPQIKEAERAALSHQDEVGDSLKITAPP